MVGLQVPVHQQGVEACCLDQLFGSIEDLVICKLQNVHPGCRTDLLL